MPYLFTHPFIRLFVSYIVQHDCIPSLCSLMDTHDLEILQPILEGLENILKMAAKYKTREAAGVERITALQTHDNCDISKLATRLIETYFADEVNLCLSLSLSVSLSLSLSLCIPCY